MALTARFASYFDSAIQRRGASHFRAGRIRIDSASAARILASVKGSSRHQWRWSVKAEISFAGAAGADRADARRVISPR